MTSNKSYRLGNYRITVYDDVLVRWEHHIPLAMARSGKCFLFGEILIIGNKFLDEDGFQIGEFFDSLRKLPPWSRTRYYCFAGELLDTATGQSLTDETLDPFSSFADRNRTVPGHTEVASPGAYRLGHYHITVAVDSRISWQTTGELNRIVGGPCSVKSNILSVGPQEHDTQGKGKQEFLDALSRLPQWDKTMAWCRASVLRPCQGIPREKQSGMMQRFREVWKDRPVDEKLHPPLKKKIESTHKPRPALARANRYEETVRRLLLSGSCVMKNDWQRALAGKAWLKWIALLVTAMVILILTAANFIVEKGFPWSHGFKTHHHKHHDRDR